MPFREVTCRLHKLHLCYMPFNYKKGGHTTLRTLAAIGARVYATFFFQFRLPHFDFARPWDAGWAAL